MTNKTDFTEKVDLVKNITEFIPTLFTPDSLNSQQVNY